MILNERFIPLGNGYGDVYELLELMETNRTRLHNTFILVSERNGKPVCSIAAAFMPAQHSHFMPIYICLEGIPYDEKQPSKRLQLFQEKAKQVECPPATFSIQPSTQFNEDELFYQYVIGILRMNHRLPPLQTL